MTTDVIIGDLNQPSAPLYLQPNTDLLPIQRDGLTYQSFINFATFKTISITDYGAVGDFDPTTGMGTSNATFIQDAIDAAVLAGGYCNIYFPAGNYYLGTTVLEFAQIQTTLAGATTPVYGLRFCGPGIIYPGAASRVLGIFNAVNCIIDGITIVGYTGGTLGSSRQFDSLISINYNSTNTIVQNCYLTNSLGYTIDTGGSLVSGGQLGFTTLNTIIRNNIIKNRYGNGIPSASGGTLTQAALAAIDVDGLYVYNNIIYGGIDLEPNLDNQYLQNVTIRDNDFRNGNVTAQATIGTAYWYDEPLNVSGGSVITQYVTCNGVASAPIVSNIIVEDNTFETGTILTYNVYKIDRIADNYFNEGQIVVGNTSGTNYTPYITVSNNTAINFLSGQSTFIQLNGECQWCDFINNTIKVGDSGYCINNNGASTGDVGLNVFANNTAFRSSSPPAGCLGFMPLANSTYLNNFASDVSEYFNWTPVDASGAGLSLTVTNATYTRQNNLIFINARITYPTTANANQVTIGGLPFTSNSAQGNQIIGIYTNNALQNVAYVGGAEILLQLTSGTQVKNVDVSGKQLFISGTYTI